MSAAQGRFTSPDPVSHPSFSELGKNVFLSEPQRWNLYANALNNPLSNIDVSGRETIVNITTRDNRIVRSDGTDVTHLGPDNWKRAVAAPLVLGSPALGAVGGSFLRGLGTGLIAWALGHPREIQEAGAGLAEGLSNAPSGALTSQFASLGTTTAASVERKLSEYILNAAHPRGGDKAAWFKGALGFDKSNMQELAKQLVFDDNLAVKIGVTEFGTKFNQTTAITGANGKTINVVVTWIRHPDEVVRMVIAVPR